MIGSRFNDPSSVVKDALARVPSVSASCGNGFVVSWCTMRVMPRTVAISLPYTGICEATLHNVPSVICCAAAVSACNCGNTVLMESTVSLPTPDALEPDSPFKPAINDIARSSWALTSMA